VSAKEWVKLYAEKLGAEAPSGGEFAGILKLAAEAAHSSERTAAPVACWVAARTGRPLEELIEIATGIGEG
jgi:Domain of unknown function (DUF6457)